MSLRLSITLCLFLLSSLVWAIEEQNSYTPSKVVYDVSSHEPVVLENILNRISLLQNIYGNNPFEASIVVVVHEGAIPLFKSNNKQHNLSHLMDRARSLTMGEIIQFKICEASARIQKIAGKDLHDFTAMVPMADAEIVMLQQKGYAYLR